MKSKDNEKYDFNNFTNTNEKTLIERNMNDPLPTMKAQFRVIGKTERYNTNYIDNNEYHNSIQVEDEYSEEDENKENINRDVDISNDWDDYSFTSW